VRSQTEFGNEEEDAEAGDVVVYHDPDGEPCHVRIVVAKNLAVAAAEGGSGSSFAWPPVPLGPLPPNSASGAIDVKLASAHTRMNTTLPLDAAVSALLRVTLLAGVPFLGYFTYQKWRCNYSAFS